MKRLLFFILLTIALLGLSPGSAKVQAINVNNFEITDYKIEYTLGRDDENRSTLKTEETITAVFPDYDQNHGIERAVPKTYDGHKTSLKVESVTDQAGKPWNYTTYTSNDNLVVRIGDADRYVHGEQTYKLVYTQRDVSAFFENTNSDEFYWDTNGIEWAVPIENLSVSLTLEEGLNPQLNGKPACYFGSFGSNLMCDIKRTDSEFTVEQINIQPYENVTIAVGFTPGTFSPYQASLAEKLIGAWTLLTLATSIISGIIVIWLIGVYHKKSNRNSELGTIVPEYIPPKNASVSTSGTLAGRYNKAYAAQLIDLAVRHYLLITETREKSWFKQANYELKIIKDTGDLRDEEKELLKDIFEDPKLDVTVDLDSLKNNTRFGRALQDNKDKINKSIATEYGLREKVPEQSKWFKRRGFILLILAILTLSPGFFATAVLAFVLGAVLKPLTEKGLALVRYLKGMEMYIKVAEEERLKIMQSPEAAAKFGGKVDPKDKKRIITLYEYMLPYAILFGQEKEWNKRLGNLYETTNESPSWYSGRSRAFNAAVFSSTMSNFTTAATYANPTSSSSGGSGGGGSSGGGGGGGGGGGW